jgi:hypothetical protein
MAKEAPSELGIRAIRQIAAQPIVDVGGARVEGGGVEGAGMGEREPETLDPAEEWHARIAQVAYRRAEKRAFAAGGELDDWLAAEREVMVEGAAGSPYRR